MQLEAELQKCQLFLNSRASKEEGLPSQLEHGDFQDKSAEIIEMPESVGDEQRAKPKTFADLLNFLENAPEGPVELDSSLLYSPSSSIHDSQGTSAETERGDGLLFNDNFLFPSSSAPPKQQRPQADHNRDLNKKNSLSKLRASQRLEELRLEQQHAEMAECSFAPHTGRPPTGPRAAQLQLKVQDRLLLAANQRKNDVARRLEEEREENERAACTFAPQLIAPPERHLREKHYIPIHERLNDEWRRKEAILEHARAKADAEAPFKPRINPISVQLAEQRRLRKESEKKKNEKEEEDVAGKISALHGPGSYSDENFDFQTKINPVSQRMLEISSQVPFDFHRRQLHFLKKREENMHSLAVDPTGEVRECSFKPDIGDTATTVLALSNKRFDQAIEGPEERWSRMAFKESQLKEERLRLKEAEIRAEEGTFQPQLNPRSLNIAEEKAYRQQTLYGNSSGNREAGFEMDFLSEKEAAQRRKREKIATRDLKECTFFPNTAKPRVVGYYDEYQPPVPNAELSISTAVRDHPCGGGPDALLQKIEEHKRKKEQWAARVRDQEERKELAECTFAPCINKSRPPATTGSEEPATMTETVAGMGRFLEVKAMAERRQSELDARAAKVFLLQPRSSKSRGGVTVPTPFRLSEARRQGPA